MGEVSGRGDVYVRRVQRFLGYRPGTESGKNESAPGARKCLSDSGMQNRAHMNSFHNLLSHESSI